MPKTQRDFPQKDLWLGACMFIFCCLMTVVRAQQPPPVTNAWALFANVKFSQRFFKTYNDYYLVPLLDTRIQRYEHQEVLLKGHYLPMDLDDKNTVILSRFPYAACFFCGGAGPESVAEIQFRGKRPRFKADQIIQVSGKLILNDRDVNHLNFILQDAELILP